MFDIDRRFSFFLMRHPNITSVSEFSSAILPERRKPLKTAKEGAQNTSSKASLIGKPEKHIRIKSETFPKEFPVVWSDDTRRWERTDDLFLSSNFEMD